METTIQHIMNKADHLIADFEDERDDYLHSHYVSAMNCDSVEAKGYLALAIERGLVSVEKAQEITRQAIRDFGNNAALFCYKEFDVTGKRLVFGFSALNEMRHFQKKRTRLY